MKTENEFKAHILPKCLELLDYWCDVYKLIGTQRETPRYSQLKAEDGKLYIYSTINSDIKYLVCDITEEQEIKFCFGSKLWEWWKENRTNHLITNHPTINAY